MNHAALPVFRKPRVAILSTGNELRRPGEITRPGEIVSSNAYGVAALVRAAGGEATDMGIVGDDSRALEAAFEAAFAAGADLVVTTGGASVGDHDLVLPTLHGLGARFHFSKVAIRPGKPLLAGLVERSGRRIRLLGLAGNPVSSMVAANVFVAPLVKALCGVPARWLEPVAARLGRDLPANDERDDYLRAGLRRLADGTLEITPIDVQDSSMLSAFARADALLVRPAGAPAARAGDPCKAVVLRAV